MPFLEAIEDFLEFLRSGPVFPGQLVLVAELVLEFFQPAWAVLQSRAGSPDSIQRFIAIDGRLAQEARSHRNVLIQFGVSVQLAGCLVELQAGAAVLILQATDCIIQGIQDFAATRQ